MKNCQPVYSVRDTPLPSEFEAGPQPILWLLDAILYQGALRHRTRPQENLSFILSTLLCKELSNLCSKSTALENHSPFM